MARFSQAAQDRRVLTTTVWEEALGPDMSTIQVYPADPYRSHPNPNPTRRPRPDAYRCPAFVAHQMSALVLLPCGRGGRAGLGHPVHRLAAKRTYAAVRAGLI